MRRAARVDRNHQEIVTALRACGATVESLASMGGGMPDLLVARGGVNYLLEVKRPELIDKAPTNRQERERLAAQQEWRERWRGPCRVVFSVDDALEAIGVQT